MPNHSQSRILVAGDTMLGRKVNEAIALAGPRWPLRHVAPLMRQADLCMVNLECAITPRQQIYQGPSKVFYFRADPEALETLVDAGVDLVSLANNHALDADTDGLMDTIALLGEHGIVSVGAGADLDTARAPVACRLPGGERVGVLAACDHQLDFAATASRPGIRTFSWQEEQTQDALIADVAAAAAEFDFLVVSLHWQPNWVERVAPGVRSLAQRLATAGADLIWGHSPHHIQGVEWLEGGALCLYSTGGLIDDYAVDEAFRNDLSLLFEVHVSEAARPVALSVHPIALDYCETRFAEGGERDWLMQHFREHCEQLGSQVRIEESEKILHVRPAAG